MIKNTFLLLIIPAIVALGLIISNTSSYALAPTSPSTGDPIYMQYDNIQGEVNAKGHEKWIELNSFQFGVGRGISKPSGGAAREASAPSVSEIVITKQMDKSSPGLFKESLVGKGQAVTIDFVKSGQPEAYIQYKLEGVLISGYSVSSGGDNPQESLSLNFAKIIFTFFDPLDILGSQPVCWNDISATTCVAQTPVPPAPPGSFNDPSNGNAITLCPAGTFSANPGSASCTQAPPGSYIPSTGAIVATLCPAGTYCPNPGTTSPLTCPAGSYCPDPASNPLSCPAGTYSPAGSIACIQAPPGSYATGPGATSPTLCPAGTFSANPGSASCTQAPPGSYIPSTGAIAATLCPAGTYCPNPGTVTPLACPAGDFCGVGTVTPLPQTEPITPSTGGGQVTFNTNAGGFTSLAAISPSGLPTPPPPGSYPFGLFSFSIFGFSPAPLVTTTITFPTPVTPGTQYLKFVGGTWVAVPFTSSGNSLTLTIADNGPLDSDPTVGAISDPSGIIVPVPGKVTGDGKIGKYAEFGLEVGTDDDKKKINGEVDYQNKTAHINFHGNKILLLSIDSTNTQATIVGSGQLENKHDDDKKKNASNKVTFLVSITDPDKTGNHDTFSITLTDSTGKVLFKNSGTVKGHIEIHKSTDKGNKSDGNHQENKNNGKNSK